MTSPLRKGTPTIQVFTTSRGGRCSIFYPDENWRIYERMPNNILTFCNCHLKRWLWIWLDPITLGSANAFRMRFELRIIFMSMVMSLKRCRKFAKRYKTRLLLGQKHA